MAKEQTEAEILPPRPIDPPHPPPEVAPARPSTMAKLEKGKYPTVAIPGGRRKPPNLEKLIAGRRLRARGPSRRSECSRHVALNRYLAMGPTRTLAGLRRALVEEFGAEAVPGVSGLNEWSRKYSWQKAAEEYEQLLAVEVRKRLVKEDAKDVYDSITAFRKVLRGLLDNTHNILAGVHKRPDGSIGGPAIVGTAKELTQLLSTAVSVSTHLQLLEGGPTARGEVRVNGRIARLTAEMSPEQLESRFQRYLGKSASVPQAPEE